jgi:hypothetical protein
MTDTADDFRRWERLGFGPWLLPIIPPGVALTAKSTVPPSQRGKVPGLRGYSGQWYGFVGWQDARATSGDLVSWGAMGAGVGLRCGVWIAVDIDVLNEEWALALAAMAHEMLGPGAVRIGRAPKRVLLYVAAQGEVITKHRLAFNLAGDPALHAVEILGEGQFFVLDGVHPGTGLPYAWPEDRPLAIDLAPVTLAQIEAYLTAVAEAVTQGGGTVARRDTAAVGTGRDGVDQEALRAPSLELLIEAAPHVPNEGGYDEWQRGLCMWRAAAAGWLDDDGRELARAWTERATGAGFGGGGHIDFDMKFGQQHPPYAVGWPHLERMAREAGWLGGVAAEFAGVLPPPAPETPPWEEPGITAQEAMFRRYVWIKSIERVGDLATREVLTRGQFNVQLAEIGPPHDSRKCAWAVFLADKDRCLHVNAVTYRPGWLGLVEEDGKGLCFNQWVDDGVKPAPGVVTDADVAPFLDLAAALYPDAKVMDLVLDWMGAVAQQPGQKPAFGLVLGGHQGVGKDSLILPLSRFVGASNVRHITMQDVLGGQTWYLARCRLLVVQEVHSFTRTEVADRFKPLLASLPPVVVVNIKFVPQYEVPNLCACVMMTNRKDALAIDRDDRRHLVAWSPAPDPNQADEATRAALDARFAALHAWYDRGGHASVGAWLLARDVSAFRRLTRAPWTEGKEEMRQAARSEAAEAIEEAAADWPDLVSPGDLAVRLGNVRNSVGKGLSGKAVAFVLRGMGAVPVTEGPVAVPQTATVGGVVKLRIWALRNAESYLGLPDAAIGRKFGEMWGATKQDLESVFTPRESKP